MSRLSKIAPADVIATGVTAPRAALRLADWIELTKPRLTMLAMLTAVAGFFLATDTPIDGVLLCATLVGTALVGAGVAVLNQCMERDVDALMPRTQDRPLPGGRVQAGPATAFGTVLTLSGAAILWFGTNPLTATLAGATIFTYLFCYTPLKRVSPWCTLVGAVPGALPPLLGYTAAAGRIDAVAALLFCILFAWQLPHFMAIALLYKDDYARASMPMLPVVDVDGRRTARTIIVWTLVMLAASVALPATGLVGPVYLAAAVLFGAAFLSAAIATARRLDLVRARRLFFVSILYLPLLLLVMVWDRTFM